MKLLLAEIAKSDQIIAELDDGRRIGLSADRGVEELRRYFDRDQSSIITRGQMIKDQLGDTEADRCVREQVDRLVRESMKRIEESCYVGIATRPPIKARRGRRPEVKPFEPARTNVLKTMKPIGKSRFAQAYDYRYIQDLLHNPSYGYEQIHIYGPFDSDITRPFIKDLIAKHLREPNAGWLDLPTGHNWLKLFQSNAQTNRFMNEQIQRGNVRNKHAGSWHIIPDKDFEELSTVGRFYLRSRNAALNKDGEE